MRNSTINRTTKETDITLTLSLDSKSGSFTGTSGVGFFDHMLNSFCVHSGIELNLKCTGDLSVDCHHTIEDIGICIGQALNNALSDKTNIARFGTSYVPMDEALAFTTLDISGRPFLNFDASFKSPKVGDMDCQMVVEFFKAVTFNGGITLHSKIEYGENDHHKIEALFKSLARALAQAIKISDGNILSTKGVL
jgi:imidazoleglycerol-phosphate dehydratase